jgi:hypothetical protein
MSVGYWNTVDRAIVVVVGYVSLVLAGCGGGSGEPGVGGNNNTNQTPNAQALQAEIAQQFPFVANVPFAVTFSCGRSNSQLTYYFDFRLDSTFQVYIELDNFQQVSFTGTYTYVGNAIRMVADPNNILMLDETTTQIVQHLGMVGEFYTPIMSCGAIGHRYNDVATDTFKSYDCPNINIQAASYEDNAFEFVHSGGNPFGFVVRGGIFRQRDVQVSGTTNPNVTRGYGIFRRVGNTFYADFGGRFADHNLLKGAFVGGDQQLSVEQLQPSAGPCNRR